MKNWPFWVSGAQLACHSIPACICLWMFLLLLFLSSLLKVNPSSGLPVWCAPPPLHATTSVISPFIPCIHCIPHYPSLLCLLCPSPPSSINPSLHAPNLPHNPPTGHNAMCRGAYRRPSLSRQPLVLGVKGKSHQCQLSEVLHCFHIHLLIFHSVTFFFFILVCHLFYQSRASSCESDHGNVRKPWEASYNAGDPFSKSDLKFLLYCVHDLRTGEKDFGRMNILSYVF